MKASVLSWLVDYFITVKSYEGKGVWNHRQLNKKINIKSTHYPWFESSCNRILNTHALLDTLAFKWHLNSLVSRLFVHQFVHADIKWNKMEKRASNAEIVSISWRHYGDRINLTALNIDVVFFLNDNPYILVCHWKLFIKFHWTISSYYCPHAEQVANNAQYINAYMTHHPAS